LRATPTRDLRHSDDLGAGGAPLPSPIKSIAGIARARRPALSRGLLAHGHALGVLDRAPTPEQGARLDLPAIQSALKRGGRKRNVAARARQIRTALRPGQLAAPAPLAAAFAATTRATVVIIAELNRQISELETSPSEHFETHPDADIYLSLPGLGVVLGARVLGEFGDDPNRCTDAKSRRNYAGTSPLTVASGRKRAVLPPTCETAASTTPSISGPYALCRPAPAPARSVTNTAPGEPPPPRPARPGQPPRGHPARLPTPPCPLQRAHRLGPPHASGGLTPYEPGMSTLPAAAAAAAIAVD
jgi:hypothetical protein